MLETVAVTAEAVGTASAPARRGLGDISARVAGVGAMTFAVVVVAQNLIRGASAPANGAASSDVLTHYADHQTITSVLVASYVLSGLGLAVFLGGAMRRLVAGNRRGWAFTGLIGASCVMALFAVVVGAEQALAVVAGANDPDTGAIQALWALHNSVFAVLDLSIAIALLGLSRAGVAAGITPRVFERLAPIGSALLLVGTLAGPRIAAGDAMPLFGLAGLGFLVWLSFLFTTGLRLVRSSEAS
jgi:hypothetical protein